jgi:hypothetical protein
MSQSQHSDFTSSLYDSEIDNLSYLTSSNHLATPSGSQYTLEASDQDFLRPIISLAVPSFFTRVGPDRRKAFILYDRMAHNDWVDWWLQTDFGRKSKIRLRHAHGYPWITITATANWWCWGWFDNRNRSEGGTGYHFATRGYFAVTHGYVNITNMPRLMACPWLHRLCTSYGIFRVFSM